MKKVKLFIEHEYDFEVVGIVSSLKEYKLAWLINKNLGINLVKQPDLKFDFVKQSSYSISNYIFETENASFQLLKNRAFEADETKAAFLLPELKQYDYLIKLKNFAEMGEISSFKEKLLNSGQIILIKEFITEDIKSKENLIF